MYINRESLTIDFNAGLSKSQLAKKHGCSIPTIRKRLIEYGLHTPRKYKKHPDRKNKPSAKQIQQWKEKAEKWDQYQSKLLNQ
jgi:transposase